MKKPLNLADFFVPATLFFLAATAIPNAVEIASDAPVPAEISAAATAPVPAETVVPAEIPEETLLLGRQNFGRTRLDKAFSGSPLKIAGKIFTHGIGTCATSMIPLDVPDGTVRFSGFVGLDDTSDVSAPDASDAAAANGSGRAPRRAEFRILDGSEILWRSETLAPGAPAEKFSVRIPAGTRKIYLLALASPHVPDESCVPDESSSPRAACVPVAADWVALAWHVAEKSPRNSDVPREPAAPHNSVNPSAPAVPAEKIVLCASSAGDVSDRGAAFREALSALRSRGGGTLELEAGEYHFFSQNALEMSFWISNHDNDRDALAVALPLVDLRNVTLRGNGTGATLVFHGNCVPALVMDSENVALENVKIDLARPLYSEAKVLGFAHGKTVVSVDKTAFPYEIRDEKIRFVGENFPPQKIESAMAFREKTKHIVAETGDIPCGSAVENLGDGTLALAHDFSRDGVGVAAGDTLVLRSWARPAPACVVYRAKNTAFRDVAIHASFGMALLAQRSENIAFTGTKNAAARTSGVFPRPETGRVHSASADATHFSNVKGKILVENSCFEAMLDDAINVHSTCLAVAEIVAPDTLRCCYKHAQALGFEIFLPGETLRFIAAETLENGATAKVKRVTRRSPTEVEIQLDGRVPAEIRPGDAVENADFQPEVVFRGNVVQNNRARGALFTTPRRVLVENNAFRNVAGSAILLAGDAQGWFESGACADVTIRKNLFENNLTSRFQFTEAVISIFPEIKNLAAQKNFYHRNIAVTENVFRTFDVPLLYAVSAEKIRFENNKIFKNAEFRAWNRKPFCFRRCADVTIHGNAVAPVGKNSALPQNWTVSDCEAELTPSAEIHF